MRVLVATTAGAGHFSPLVPFARALVDAGHEVVVAAPASFASAVERAGFAHQPLADAPREDLQAIFASLQGASNDEGNAVVVREVFGRMATRAALPGMRAVVERWRPNLVLREPSELSSYVVAEEFDVPHVRVAIGLASVDDRFLPLLEDPLAEAGSRSGLAGLRSAPCLSLVPPSMEENVGLGSGVTKRFRDASPSDGRGEMPGRWGDPAHPLVYVTFGSVAGSLGMFPALYRDVAAALADLPVRVLMTTGEGGDPGLLEPLPPNIHVERWWPQQSVMPHAAAMVGHGGFGTTLTGLAFGVPMVVVPLFADQPDNARRVQALGAGISLDQGPASIGRLAGAVERVLADASYRVEARAVADEIARLPDASEAVAPLEQMAR